MDSPLKSLPYNFEAEQSVIGSMLKDKTAIASAAESFKADDFYKDSHKVIYNAIFDLYKKDMAIDMITLLEELRSTEKLEGAGGVTYITEISNSVLSTANVNSYINIVKDKAILRRLIKSSTEIIENCYNNQNDVEAVLDIAEQKIFNIAEKKNSSDFEAMHTVLERGFLQIEQLFNNKGSVNGVPSGFPQLDNMTSGLQKGT